MKQSMSISHKSKDWNICRGDHTFYKVLTHILPIESVLFGPTLALMHVYLSCGFNNLKQTSHVIQQERKDYSYLSQMREHKMTYSTRSVSNSITFILHTQSQKLVTGEAPFSVCYGMLY